MSLTCFKGIAASVRVRSAAPLQGAIVRLQPVNGLHKLRNRWRVRAAELAGAASEREPDQPAMTVVLARFVDWVFENVDKIVITPKNDDNHKPKGMVI